MIKLLESADGHTLAISINGYRVFQTYGADVIAMPTARVFSNSIHAELGQEDMFRESLTDEIEVWMADTDRGHCTAWSFSGGDLARYVATLPPKE